MTTTSAAINRRGFIRRIAKCLLGAAAWPSLPKAWAMGDLAGRQGVIELEGSVLINGQSAQKGLPVNPGDVIATGADSRLVFVMGKDAFLLRERTRLEIGAGAIAERALEAGQAMRLIAGKVLAVWGRGNRRFETATAVVAVRGTGIYFEAQPDVTYICTCYGRADIAATGDPAARETVQTTHHESPRFVYAGKAGQLIEPAPVVNHTDAELTRLEFLVGRTPPFVKGSGY